MAFLYPLILEWDNDKTRKVLDHKDRNNNSEGNMKDSYKWSIFDHWFQAFKMRINGCKEHPEKEK